MNLCKTCGTICPFDDERTECDAYAPMTNENWLRSCTTEQLVSFLLWYPNNVHGYPKPKMSIAEEEDAIRVWLKQPHHD